MTAMKPVQLDETELADAHPGPAEASGCRDGPMPITGSTPATAEPTKAPSGSTPVRRSPRSAPRRCR
jgi:hypothetical protein